MRLLIVLLLCSRAFAWENASWLNEVEKRIDEDAVAWLRKQINPIQEKQAHLLDLSSDCGSCTKGKILEIEDPKLFVFISFSVPENIWLSLAQEMEAYQAIFVLRGLPDNSFKSCAQKITHLKEKGMGVSIQVHPSLFKEYAIQSVPTIVFADSETIHKISGALSLSIMLLI